MRYAFHIPQADVNVELIFLLGKVSDENLENLLKIESSLFGDILQVSVKDAYNNLAYKTIGGFDYILDHRKDADFIIKTDDDLWWNFHTLR